MGVLRPVAISIGNETLEHGPSVRINAVLGAESIAVTATKQIGLFKKDLRYERTFPLPGSAVKNMGVRADERASLARASAGRGRSGSIVRAMIGHPKVHRVVIASGDARFVVDLDDVTFDRVSTLGAIGNGVVDTSPGPGPVEVASNRGVAVLALILVVGVCVVCLSASNSARSVPASAPEPTHVVEDAGGTVDASQQSTPPPQPARRARSHR